ncbi:MAG: Choline-sulfatase [Chloroflexi bacterium AL-W]|nr:Choline-sulfatase [Chloroflexi bacterium AL-N1]NOK67426.1 Choline-sulfatase [Chloroflexi bacterium AL-N10]NOK75082.1 Choline-sulfatase [Chloroflexi bacterium AL-N5]NOK81869.1 Choline-sulfatase [Chloroflexi bacterium AL-W]NOK89715.1 Choline-sulfatase [Chloroflexi bacterium AL-N15]
MRIIYIDIDSLRPDHLGCYGYPRHTSPSIDRIAEQGVRFTNCYVSDAPCLPSRTALWSGRFGFQTGVVSHGGTTSQPSVEGPQRGHQDRFGTHGWMAALRRAGLTTTTISSFAERHSAWHWYAGFSEIINPGQGGMEQAHTVTALALDWLKRHAQRDHWFLHINYWDPHTPYRVPEVFGTPLTHDPLPTWITEEVRQIQWNSSGPHSAQEPHGFGQENDAQHYPRVPVQIDSLSAVRQWIDGYDVGVSYTDEYIGRIMQALTDAKLFDNTVIIISADHGENLGELNVWGDHQTADSITCRVPLIVRWPGITDMPRVDDALHYQFDWAATMLELMGQQVPETWDGQSFAEALHNSTTQGRPHLVLSQGAWTCQRGVRVGDHLYLRTYDPCFKELPPELLFDLAHDPHEQHDLMTEQLDMAQQARRILDSWELTMLRTNPTGTDLLVTTIREGGSIYARGRLMSYVERLRATGRTVRAEQLLAEYSDR